MQSAQDTYICNNNTRQGYARKRTLKLAGYFFWCMMAKHAFAKPATTIPEQIEILRSRGMRIDDESQAQLLLQHVSYYRLAAYWRPFERDSKSHLFRQGTSLKDVVDLYTFDRDLRLLLLDAIECIEVSLRSTWAHTLALEAGAHADLDVTLAKSEIRWRQFLGSLMHELSRSKEVFVQHLHREYSDLTPPIWAISEVLSLGALSKWYENIGPKRIKTRIAKHYDVNEQVLESWCRHLTYVRNICARHSRLWNRDFTITPAIPRMRSIDLANDFVIGSRNLYNTLIIIVFLLDRITPHHNVRARLIELIMSQGASFIPRMGFPNDWMSRKIWRN